MITKTRATRIAASIFEGLHEQIGSDEIETNSDGQPLVTIVGNFDTDMDELDTDTLDVEFGRTEAGTHWPLSRYGSVEALAEELVEAFEIHEDCERNNAAAKAEDDARFASIED